MLLNRSDPAICDGSMTLLMCVDPAVYRYIAPAICDGSMKALLRLSFIKALLRLSFIKALLRLSFIKAPSRHHSGFIKSVLRLV